MSLMDAVPAESLVAAQVCALVHLIGVFAVFAWGFVERGRGVCDAGKPRLPAAASIATVPLHRGTSLPHASAQTPAASPFLEFAHE